MLSDLLQIIDAAGAAIAVVTAVMALGGWQAWIVRRYTAPIQNHVATVERQMADHEEMHSEERRVVADAFAREGMRGPDGWPTTRQRAHIGGRT